MFSDRITVHGSKLRASPRRGDCCELTQVEAIISWCQKIGQFLLLDLHEKFEYSGKE